jgi:hypothetical protein
MKRIFISARTGERYKQSRAQSPGKRVQLMEMKYL